MSRSASFNRLAEQEFAEAILYYEFESAGLGRRFLEEVEGAIAETLEHPEAAPAVRGTVRRKVLKTFPYNLLYRVRGNEIRILAVMHQKRRPSYWVGRS